MNKTKQKQTHRYREQTNGYQWGRGHYWGGGMEEWETQTIGYKRDSSIHCKHGE